MPRKDSEPGKGAFWTIDEAAETQFKQGVYKKAKRSNSTSKETVSPTLSHKHMKLEAEHHDEEEQEEEDDDDEDEQDEFNADGEEEQAQASDSHLAQVKKEEIKAEMTEAATEPMPDLKDDDLASSPTSHSTSPISPSPSANTQSQLQDTIRQHLLDPTKYPLPPSIAQLLPQAIAQLPPQLANQIASTLKSVACKSNSEKPTLWPFCSTTIPFHCKLPRKYHPFE